MTQLSISEEDIEAAEDLRSQGKFVEALALTRELLSRVPAQNANTRMRLLFDIVYCSSPLDDLVTTEEAMNALNELPQPSECRALANQIRIWAEIELRRPLNAIALADSCLETGFFERQDWRIHKYGLLHQKGKALIWLRRSQEALTCLEEAQKLIPSINELPDETERAIYKRIEPEILTDLSNCFLGMDRLDECYEAASKAKILNDEYWSPLALLYMAECRAWQRRFSEALEMYTELEKRLPCRCVDEERVRTGIRNCRTYLDKRRTPDKPS